MKKLVLVLATLTIVGCANQRFDLRATDAAPAQQSDQSFWISGIGQTQTADAAKICGGTDKVARIETQETALNIVFRVITLGIYTPREMRITCVR
jgi:uncharacterized lipoprotein YajG